MRTLCAGLLLGFTLLLAAAPLAAQTPAPGTPQAPREIYIALGFGDPVFEPMVWQASASERDDRTTATWVSTTYGALGHAEYLHFTGGYEPENLSAFFDNEWFNVSFKDYDDWQRTTRCSFDGVALYEFQLDMGGQQYVMRYWIQPVTPTRILTMHLVFPVAQADLLDEYSQRFAPLAWKCDR
ncbi:MAG: hypothetical protein JNL34_13510 [Anaerolineae bacterium]|nr:hypothetical protein [Anaerolineae bacterium]